MIGRAPILLGIHQGKPAFACAGDDPPRWLVKAKKAGKIEAVDDETIRLGSTLIRVGETVRKEYLRT